MAVEHETYRFDERAPRQSRRRQRQTGCEIYIPAAMLRHAGIDPADPPPEYTLTASKSRGRTVFVKLYPR